MFVLRTKEKTVSFSASSTVCFARLDDDEIVYYVDKYRPFDKPVAMAYRNGSGTWQSKHQWQFYNVMGLPVRLLYQELKKF